MDLFQNPEDLDREIEAAKLKVRTIEENDDPVVLLARLREEQPNHPALLFRRLFLLTSFVSVFAVVGLLSLPFVVAPPVFIQGLEHAAGLPLPVVALVVAMCMAVGYYMTTQAAYAIGRSCALTGSEQREHERHMAEVRQLTGQRALLERIQAASKPARSMIGSAIPQRLAEGLGATRSAARPAEADDEPETAEVERAPSPTAASAAAEPTPPAVPPPRLPSLPAAGRVQAVRPPGVAPVAAPPPTPRLDTIPAPPTPLDATPTRAQFFAVDDEDDDDEEDRDVTTVMQRRPPAGRPEAARPPAHRLASADPTPKPVQRGRAAPADPSRDIDDTLEDDHTDGRGFRASRARVPAGRPKRPEPAWLAEVLERARQTEDNLPDAARMLLGMEADLPFSLAIDEMSAPAVQAVTQTWFAFVASVPTPPRARIVLNAPSSIGAHYLRDVAAELEVHFDDRARVARSGDFLEITFFDPDPDWRDAPDLSRRRAWGRTGG
jgi:hypothetical protein